MRGIIARIGGKVGVRDAPSVGVDGLRIIAVARADFEGDKGIVACPEPYFNTLFLTLLHSIISAAVCVEAGAVGVGRVEGAAAPLIVLIRRIAIGGYSCPRGQ